MPAKWFIEDGKKYLIADVLSSKVVMKEYPLAYLKEAVSRDWDGYLHVTDLYNGARETFLKYTTFYAVNPDKLAFAISGTLKHKQLEEVSDEDSEKPIIYRGVRGTLDLLMEGPGGEIWLCDYKTQGAFAIRKFMGWTKVPEQVFDKHGIPVRYKSGVRKGELKYRNKWILDPNKADREQYEYQLNIYRKAIEEQFPDVKISKMKIFFILRDGGLKATLEQGLTRNTYFLDVDFLDDKTINDYIDSKSFLKDIIEEFIESEIKTPETRLELLKKLVPPKCSKKERWYNEETGVSLKCQSYCPVKEVCEMLGEK